MELINVNAGKIGEQFADKIKETFPALLRDAGWECGCQYEIDTDYYVITFTAYSVTNSWTLSDKVLRIRMHAVRPGNRVSFLVSRLWHRLINSALVNFGEASKNL